MKVMTRVELDQMKCGNPGCECGGELYLHSRCHPDAPLIAAYYQGVLTVGCAECEKPVVNIAVADGAGSVQ